MNNTIKRTLSIIKYICLANVIATIFVFCLWFVNGYKPVLGLSLTWGLYFGYSMYSRYRTIQSVSDEMLNEIIEKQIKKENEDV